uniref:Uncharacterized protein n=1 Tax=Meloidogyne floridensis TaxID=298350 RepID=A0A915NWK3_9BILA
MIPNNNYLRATSQQQQKHVSQQPHFLGEDNYRASIELIYFIPYIGRIDASTSLQIGWSLVGFLLAIIPIFGGKRGEKHYKYLWPLLSLKIMECSVCVLLLVFTFILGVTGPLGYALLRLAIQWKYRRIEGGEG